MDIEKLNLCMEILKRDMGEGLIASMIVSEANSETLLVTENPTPLGAVRTNELASYIRKALSEGPYPELGDYFYVDLEKDKGFLVIPSDGYRWGIAIDSQKIKLGLLLNVIMPAIVGAFKDAVTS